MSKFKVGDKVRIVFGDGRIEWVNEMRKFIGETATISEVSYKSGHPWFKIEGHFFHWNECDAELIEQPRREFIVIRRSGAETIAELRHDREVIKSGTAICNASDTFDFDTGAKLAFDRLMGREEPKPAPQPAHRFKVGDRVFIDPLGFFGTVVLVDEADAVMPYHVKHEHNGYWWAKEYQLSHAPAPEPPKFYTGKVVLTEAGNCAFCKELVGQVIAFKDGLCDDPFVRNTTPFTSFSDFVSHQHSDKWIEVKVPIDV